MIWYSILLSILLTGASWLIFKHKFVWWELFVAPAATTLAIVISFYTMKGTSLSDVEYNGYIITEARYYEPYETWVHKTCTETYACGTYSSGSGKNRTTHTKYCTRTYDCSYCDYNKARYYMYDTGGHEISITEAKYKYLIKRWSANPEFVELNRDIRYHGGCGKDGDMYSIKWNQKIETSLTSTYEKSFTNILKCNHSAFNFPVIEPEIAKKSGLYDYPQVGEYQKQNTVLGLDSLDIKYKPYFQTKLNYLNGMLGQRYKVRIYTLLFKDKDMQIAFNQEAYWDGGNQNEIVVCIGVDKNGKINWVKPFSFTDGKRVLVDIRDDVAETKVLDVHKLFDIYESTIKKNWKFKSFKDFDYLSFEPTTGQLIFAYIFAMIVTVGCIVWCVMNELDDDGDQKITIKIPKFDKFKFRK